MTSVRSILALAVLLCLIVVPGPAAAQHEEPEEHTASEEPAAGGEHEEHGEEGEHGGHEFHRNHVVLFLGFTEGEEHHGEKGNPDFTIGFDYERRLSKRFGFGGMVDWVVEGNREWLVGVPAFIHIAKNGKFTLAPAVHRVRETEETEFLFRFGFNWNFKVGKFTLAPFIAYDVTEGQDFTILGAAIGKGW